jgi:Protein of unknown function (DUF3253)
MTALLDPTADQEMTERGRISEKIAQMAASRATKNPLSTMCPSEAARELYSTEVWRAKMPLVRAVAGMMVLEGRIVICQKGQTVLTRTKLIDEHELDPSVSTIEQVSSVMEQIRGPIRLRWIGSSEEGRGVPSARSRSRSRARAVADEKR